MVPSSPLNISVEVIDSSTNEINDRIIGIVNIETYSQGSFGIIVASNTTIYVVSMSNGVRVLKNYPCGFDNIVSAKLIGNNQYQVINQNNLTCICDQNFSNCYIVTSAKNTAFSSEPPVVVLSNSQEENQTFLVKKNLYDIIGKGLFATILQNNSVLLVDAHTRGILDMVTMDCS